MVLDLRLYHDKMQGHDHLPTLSMISFLPLPPEQEEIMKKHVAHVHEMHLVTKDLVLRLCLLL